MSSQSAIQLATAIQSKVGSSLISAQNLLPQDQAAGVIAQAGASSLGVFLLRDLHEMQQRTFMCVEKVANILQSQLNLAIEKERREKDQAAELSKEKRSTAFIGPSKPGVAGGKINDNLDDIEDAINKGSMSELITGGLTAALLAPQALKSIGKGIGKKLIRGGIYAAIAGFVSKPIIDFVNNEFDLDLTNEAKKDIEFGMLGAAAGFGVAGIPGAIIGATVPMITRVAQYINGSLSADQVSDSDFAGAALGGSALTAFTALKAGGFLKGVTGFATFGTALASLPVVIAIGAGTALGVGVMFLKKKIDLYQQQILDRLAKTVEQLDKEMGEFAARQEEGILERMGVNLGKVSALGEAKIAAQEASEQLGNDKKKFLADTQTQTTLNSLANAMLNYNDDAISTILQDGTKANNFLDTIENLKSIAAKGGFGEDSGTIFEAMAAFSDRVQNVAIKMVDEGITGGKVSAVALNKSGIGGDQLENLPQMEQKEQDLISEQNKARQELDNARIMLADAQTRNDGIFDTKEVNELQDTIKGLVRLVGKDGESGTIARDLRNNKNDMNRFGTLNGLLYNLDDLRELYKDDDESLKRIIERSVNQTGSEVTGLSTDSGGTVIINNIDNSSKSQVTSTKQDNHVGTLDTTSDNFYSREAYGFSTN